MNARVYTHLHVHTGAHTHFTTWWHHLVLLLCVYGWPVVIDQFNRSQIPGDDNFSFYQLSLISCIYSKHQTLWDSSSMLLWQLVLPSFESWDLLSLASLSFTLSGIIILFWPSGSCDLSDHSLWCSLCLRCKSCVVDVSTGVWHPTFSSFWLVVFLEKLLWWGGESCAYLYLWE